jgi:outer membrane protein
LNDWGSVAVKIRLKLCAAWIAFACAPAQATDFLQTYQLAKANDAIYASARALFEAEQERKPQGLALLLPTVTAEGTTSMNDVETSAGALSSQSRFNEHGWGITLTQPVFRWQNIMQYQQADFQVQQAAAILGQAEQDLIVRVAEAYFEVLAARDNLEFVGANKTAISEQLAQAKRNFEVGTATITDTNEAQARYDLAVSQEIAGLNALEIAQRALEQITAAPTAQVTPLKPEAKLPAPEPNNMNQWVDAALSNNLGVKAGEAAMEVAGREIEKQRAGHYPSIDAFATYQEDHTARTISGLATSQPLRADTGVLGLRLTVPIFEGGAVNSRTRQAVALRERARHDLDTARRTAQFDTRQAFLNVSSGLAQSQALKQALISSETALQSNRIGYEVGVRINIDVLNAQQQVFQTQRDLARARYETIVNGLRLKAAAGSLSEADVVGVNGLLMGN